MQFLFKISTSYRWNSPKLKDIRTWLTVNVGPPYKEWMTGFEGGLLSVNFLHERDAILFALRWS